MARFYGTNPQYIAETIVRDYILDHTPFEDPDYAEFEVNLVWFCYILGGWKALVCSNLPDQTYFEVSYDKLNKKVYLDVYDKRENIEIEVH